MLDSLWTRVLATMEGKIPETAIDSWLRPCRVTAMEGDLIRVAAPNKYSRDWLVQHYTEALQAAARTVLGGNPVISIEIDREPDRAPAARPRDPGGAALQWPLAPLHLRVVRRRQLEPVRPGRLPGGRRAPVQGLQPALHLRRSRPRQDAPPARGRPRDLTPLPVAPPALPLDRALHQRSDQRHPLRSRPPSSGPSTAPSTSSSSTTSSSSPARSAPRRSSSTPSTTSTRRGSRSSSPPTPPPRRSPRSRSASAPGSSGA